MKNFKRKVVLSVIAQCSLSGCGLYVPAKSELKSDVPQGPTYSQQGAYENAVVGHIACEIATGIAQIQQFELPWINKWGTSVTLTITAQDQSGVSPNISTFAPFHNIIRTFPTGGPVTISRSVAWTAGVSGAATATRTETIQFTYLNSDLLVLGRNYPTCDSMRTGVQIDGDLQIRQFLFDKAMIARYGNASLFDQRSASFPHIAKRDKPFAPWQWAVFNTFTEEITFVAAFGGSVTPTWKLSPVSFGTTGTLVAAERTYTNDLIITVGPLGANVPSATTPISLDTSAQNQHNARVQANAIATSIQGQQH